MADRKQLVGDYYKLILMALLNEGPLSLKELEERTFAFVYHFHGFGYSLHEGLQKGVSRVLSRFGYHPQKDSSAKMKHWREKHERQVDVKSECSSLVERGLVRLNSEGKHELTDRGREEAQQSAQAMEKAAKVMQNQLLSPTAAARNTVLADFLLALMKVSAGLLSGSVGLIADGADAAIDTVSATVVWIGIRCKKELLGALIIIAMMFTTAASVGYESVTKIIDTVASTIAPISMPLLVIAVEGIALIAAAVLHFYQRYVGKRSGSLALISQSVDSKNHVYVAMVVIMGAVCSMFGIHFVDALVGAFIAVRVFVDGFGLSKEVFFSIKGEETDFAKYPLPLEKRWRLGRLETFRTWVLYSIKEDHLTSKHELVRSLERTFKPRYIPVLSEFKFSLGDGVDFQREFDSIVQPLLDEKFVVQRNGNLILTPDGENRVERVFKNLRYRQTG